jgi:CrcB protein
MNWLLVIAGGMAGAPLRYLTDRAVQSWHGTVFPWGTIAVNVAGSLILGVLTGGALQGAGSDSLRLLLGTGLCGALTTYSTFSYETLRLAETGAALSAAVNVVLSVTGAIAAVFAGAAIAQAVWG